MADVVIDKRTLALDVDRLARALVARGVQPGDRVAAILPNGAPFFVAGLATARCEATFLPINWHLKEPEIEWITTDSAAKVVVTADNYDELLASAPDGRRRLPDGFPAPAFMFYTSGTTGPAQGRAAREARRRAHPDGAGHARRDVGLRRRRRAHPVRARVPRRSRRLRVQPPVRRRAVVIQPTWDAREWLRLVDRAPGHDDVHDAGPLHPRPRGARRRAGRLRPVVAAADHPRRRPLPDRRQASVHRGGAEADVYELYGASEGGATRISSKEWLEQPGSVGTPWPGTDVKVDDAGVIWIRPPGGVGFKYHNDPEKTAGAWDGEYFTVGDIGHIDEDGYLYITDRISDMVIRGGVNIYPREIEDVLHTHPAVVDCAVFGIPDDRHGEILKAVVEVRGAGRRRRTRRPRQASLADFKCPERLGVRGRAAPRPQRQGQEAASCAENLGEDLDTLDDARAGPREVGVPVDRNDVRDVGELRDGTHRRQLGLSACDVVSARHEHDDIGTDRRRSPPTTPRVTAHPSEPAPAHRRRRRSCPAPSARR